MRSNQSRLRRNRLSDGSRASRHQLVTTVLQKMKEGMVCEAHDGRVLELNQAAVRLLGLRTRHTRGSSLLDLGIRFLDESGEALPPGRTPAAIAMRKGSPVYGHQVAIHRQGEVRYLSVDAIPVTIASSRRVVCVYRDITYMVTGSQEIRRSRQRFERVVEGAPVGIGLCDGDGRLHGSNLPLSRILGRPADEIDGRSLSDWLVEGDPDAFRAQLREHARTRRKGHLSATVARPDGEQRELRLSAVSFGDTGSGPFALFVEDVSEQRQGRRVEKMLARAADIFSTSIANLADRMEVLADVVLPAVADICLVDVVEGRDGGMRRVHASHSDSDRQGLLGDLGLFPLGTAVRENALLGPGQTLHGGLPISAHLDGTPIDAALAAALERLEISSYITLPMHARGRLVGAITFLRSGERASFSRADTGLARAISTRVAMGIDNVRLYGRMEKALDARDRLLAIVSHDLRNPIGTAVEALDLLQLREQEGENAMLTRNLAIADRSLRRALGLIDDLLDLRRRDHGTLGIEPNRVDLVEFLAEVVAANSLLAAREGITIRTRSRCDGACGLFADRDRLHQVFANLISNAIKNTPRGAAIRVIAIAREDTVLLAVSDSGTGMTEAQIESMLEWGWQAQEDDRRGFGIGLAVVKMIVETHGGRVAARRRPAGGLCVQVILPRSPDGTHDSAVEPLPEPPAGGIQPG